MLVLTCAGLARWRGALTVGALAAIAASYAMTQFQAALSTVKAAPEVMAGTIRHSLASHIIFGAVMDATRNCCKKPNEKKFLPCFFQKAALTPYPPG